MLFLSINTLVGAVVGSVLAVTCPKVFAFVAKQWGSAKAKVENVAASTVVAAVEDQIKKL